MKMQEKMKTERRKCRMIAPFVFCILELVIFFELSYIYISFLGFIAAAKYLLAIGLAYYVGKSFIRTYNILRRCDLVKNQKVYIAKTFSY